MHWKTLRLCHAAATISIIVGTSAPFTPPSTTGAFFIMLQFSNLVPYVVKKSRKFNKSFRNNDNKFQKCTQKILKFSLNFCILKKKIQNFLNELPKIFKLSIKKKQDFYKKFSKFILKILKKISKISKFSWRLLKMFQRSYRNFPVKFFKSIAKKFSKFSQYFLSNANQFSIYFSLIKTWN